MNKKYIKTTLIISVATLVMITSVGCSDQQNTLNKSTKNAVQNNAKTSSIALTVNGQQISADDFSRRLFKARFVQAAQGVNYDGQDRDQVYLRLKEHTIETLIRETIIMQEAQNNNVSVSDAEVEQVLNDIKGRFPSEEAFKTTMQSRGLDEATIKAYNRLQMTSVNLMKKLGGQDKFDEYINEKITKAQVETDNKLIDKLLFDLSKSTANPLDTQNKL